ncbi:hypothetical protein AF72_01335 [Xylella taiwanensis]|uniref:Uncharacterized protein n=1 Tax=Xylella taiwanensis TaxID=1444770 RepID=Z9JM45_9GAMM|nr:hypothetical protein AB672_05030 [Xylella taiwanensis]EWS79244.1 hypothetical protein AF72_01335 [Xylella taiwanensis]
MVLLIYLHWLFERSCSARVMMRLWPVSGIPVVAIKAAGVDRGYRIIEQAIHPVAVGGVIAWWIVVFHRRCAVVVAVGVAVSCTATDRQQHQYEEGQMGFHRGVFVSIIIFTWRGIELLLTHRDKVVIFLCLGTGCK